MRSSSPARRRRDDQPADWRAAEAYHGYALKLTAAELAELTDQIDRLVRPFIAMTRQDAPTDADVALLRLLAFRHPQSPETLNRTESRVPSFDAPGATRPDGHAFRGLCAAVVVSEVGDWLLFIALPLYVLRASGSALATSTVFLADSFPRSSSAPSVGR